MFVAVGLAAFVAVVGQLVDLQIICGAALGELDGAEKGYQAGAEVPGVLEHLWFSWLAGGGFPPGDIYYNGYFGQIFNDKYVMQSLFSFRHVMCNHALSGPLGGGRGGAYLQRATTLHARTQRYVEPGLLCAHNMSTETVSCALRRCNVQVVPFRFM